MDYLEHHGILGQKWGVRRYQNPDGSLTQRGKEKYARKKVREAFRVAEGAVYDGRHGGTTNNSDYMKRKNLNEAKKVLKESDLKAGKKVTDDVISKYSRNLKIASTVAGTAITGFVGGGTLATSIGPAVVASILGGPAGSLIMPFAAGATIGTAATAIGVGSVIYNRKEIGRISKGLKER